MNGVACERVHLCECGENIGHGTAIARFLSVKEPLVMLDRIGKAPIA